MADTSKGCTNFLDLVVDDNLAFEGNEEFNIVVGISKALVTIVDDDGMCELFYSRINIFFNIIPD